MGSVTLNNGGTLQVTGGGKMYANLNINDYNAITVNAGGSLVLNSWAWGDSLGTLYLQYQNLVVNGGTISTTGASNGTSNNGGGRAFTIGAAGATLNSAAAGQTWSIVKYNSGDSYQMASNGGLLTLTGPGNGLFAKNIPGTGGLTKAGTGTWTLSARIPIPVPPPSTTDCWSFHRAEACPRRPACRSRAAAWTPRPIRWRSPT